MIAVTLFGIAAPIQAQELKSGIDKANMDLNVKPGDDFYEYSAGNWLKSHPLDAVHPMNGAFVDLEEQNNDRIKGLVAEYAAKKLPQGTDGQKLGALYRMYMDSVRRNKQGYAPIKKTLARIRKVKDRKECVRLMFELGAKGYGTELFNFGLGINPNKAGEYMFTAYQGGIGLDPEYYTNPNGQQKAVVEAYKSLMKDYLKMVGNKEAVAEKKMQAVFALETQLAKKSYDQVKRRNPKENTHLMSWRQLLQDFKDIDWKTFCDIYGWPSDIDTVNVKQPEPLHEVENILANADLEAIKANMEVSVVSSAANTLSDAFGNRRFEYLKTTYGLKEQQPRWKRAVGFLDRMLGEAIGKLYVAKYFPESSKTKMLDLVENLKKAFSQHIDELDWMSDSTKAKAHEKLDNFTVKIGYPDKWKDYSTLDIDPQKSYYENLRAAGAWYVADNMSKLGQPTDKTEWGMSPQTVNAYYNPTTNEICFPAAILQPPFFNADADDAVNYGGIGVVIGHEMSHGFDDQGRLFDKDGNMSDWWTAEDAEKFNAKAQVLVAQFDSVEVVPGVHANGQLSLGENIGDHGGLSISFTAMQNANAGKNIGLIDGFTPEQRFYLSYGTIWAQNITDEEKVRLTKLDVHSLAVNRVNVSLRNFQTFFDAFGIKEGDPMWRPESERVHIW